MRPELCVGALVVDAGRLLLVERARPPGVGLWSVPGGRVERGERMVDALRREVLEETGLRVDVGALVGWVERISDDFHFVIADFFATVRGSTVLRAGDDASNAEWIAFDALSGYELVPGLAEFLQEHNVANQADPTV